MDDGYVKEHRSIMEHAIFQDDWLFRLSQWCVMKANYKPSTFKGKTIPVGSFVTGRLRAAEELGVTPSKWYRGIHKLAEFPYDFITLESNNEWTIVTVCNYTRYQSGEDTERTTTKEASEQQTDSLNHQRDKELQRSQNSQRTASEQQANTIEESKNIYSLSKETAQTKIPKLPARYNTPEVHAWVSRWQSHWFTLKLVPLSDSQLDVQLMEPARLGWSAEKLCRAFEKSIAGGYPRLYDPDEPSPSQRAVGAASRSPQRQEPSYDVLAPRKPRRPGGAA